MMTNTVMRGNLRAMVRGAYDLQKLRIEMGNRLVGNFKVRMGQAPGEKEEEMSAEGKEILANLRAAYDKLTDGVVKFPRASSFKGNEVISSFTELALVAQYLDLDKSEATHFGRLKHVLKDFAIYTQFLEEVRGVGPAMAGVIVAEIDITRAQYPSSLWKYAGLDVASDGVGRSRRKEHLVQVDYVNKAGEAANRVGLTFNPWLKTKLYVLATCFIKAGGPYREIYDGYKHRLESIPQWAERSKGHRHNAAMRYMTKQFLADLYNAWRPLEGLPVAPSYAEGKLGIVHRQSA